MKNNHHSKKIDLDKNLFVLDCTFRDGGYYNNWDFPRDLVSRYLNSLKTSKVDVVEIGFRSLPRKEFLGGFAYSSDDFLNSLDIPEGLSIAVMVNAKELLAHSNGVRAAIDSIFQEAESSPISLVRVALTLDLLEDSRAIFLRLKELGYIVSLNLMQVNNIFEEQLIKAVSMVKGWNAVDIFYFADSFGNMDLKSVSKVVNVLKKYWGGHIGIHAHDNMGQALANTLAAVDSGVSWLDGTILGMGRGAGNVCMELLLLELKRRNRGSYYPDAIFPIVIEDFKELKNKYKWGPNLLYYLSGVYGIHPTYVQEMLGKARYKTDQIISALEILKNSGSRSYTNQNLMKAMTNIDTPSQGTWEAGGWAKGRNLLILGSGPSLKLYANDITRFILKNNPIVISLNINSYIPSEHITAYAVCHKTRLLLESEKYKTLNKPLIVPVSNIPEIVQEKFTNVDVLDFGMSTQENSFIPYATGCTIPVPIVAAYILALGITSDAENIFLVGFDGYEPSDPRQREMEHVLELYKKHPKAIPVIALTPTTYSAIQDSLFSPVYNSMNTEAVRGDKA